MVMDAVESRDRFAGLHVMFLALRITFVSDRISPHP